MNLRIPSTNIDSLLVAVVLMASMLSSIASLALGVSSGANLLVLIIIFVLAFLKFIINPKETLRCSYRTLILCAMVMIIFVLSKFFCGERCDYSFSQLLFYALVPICAVDTKFDSKKVIEYALVISLFSITIINDMFEIKYESNGQADLGRMYTMLTVIILAVFHFMYYRKNVSKVFYLVYVYAFYILVKALLVSNRGVFLAICFAIFVSILYNANEKGEMKQNRIKQFLIWGTVIILVLIVIANLEAVVSAAIAICQRFFGITPSFFIKMQRYIHMNNITNNRVEVFSTAIEGIKNSPVFGNGMSTFKADTNGAHGYPHNFILQFFYEGGIIFAVLPVFLAVRIAFNVLSGNIKNKDEYVWQAMLVCQCYPKMLISADAWKFTILWLLIAYSYKTLTAKKELRANDE